MKLRMLPLGLLATISLLLPTWADTAENLLLIEDVTLISPGRGEPREHMSVLIKGERISEISTAHSLKAEGGTVISGKGKFLIPGLIDSHVHLGSVVGVDNEAEPKLKGMIADYFKQLPRSYLYFGYTTVVDLAVFQPEVLSDFRKSPLHPDLFDCGGSLPIANGYPMAFLPKEIRFKIFPNFIYDPKQAKVIPTEYKPEAHTPEAAVARVKSGGGICVKTYWEPGFGKQMNFPVHTDDNLRSITTAARAGGLVTMLHANSLDAQEHAVTADVDIIAHGMFSWGSALKKSPGIPPRVKKVLDHIVARGTGYMPTIQVIGGTQSLADPKFLDDPQLKHVLPQAMINYYRSPEGKWFKNIIEKDEQITLTMETNLPPLSKVERVTRYLAAKDANLVFGTDTPSSPTYGNPPGYNGFLEMRRWKESDVPLPKILYAATAGNAKALKIDHLYGRIEEFKIANLLLLEKNPYVTLDAYDAIDVVILHGKVVERKSLKANQ